MRLLELLGSSFMDKHDDPELFHNLMVNLMNTKDWDKNEKFLHHKWRDHERGICNDIIFFARFNLEV